MHTCTDCDVSHCLDAAANGQTKDAETAQTFAATASVTVSFYATRSEGAALSVRYVADDPTIREIEPGTALIGAVILLLIAGIFVGTSG